MSEQTKIAYVHSTWNVYRGCTLQSACEVRNRCWAAGLAAAWGWNFDTPHLLWGNEVWRHPYEWNTEAQRDGTCRLVFAGDLGELFQDRVVVNRVRPRIWAAIKETPNVVYFISTKAPENIERFLPADWGDGYPNVWLAVTVTSPKTFWRMDALRQIPAALRAVNAEPLWQRLGDLNLDGFGWLIVGGESGRQCEKNPMQLSWALDVWEKTRSRACAFFFKQVSARRDECGIDAVDRAVFGHAGPRIRTREWPRTVRPLIPIPERGRRFTEAEWKRYRQEDRTRKFEGPRFD